MIQYRTMARLVNKKKDERFIKLYNEGRSFAAIAKALRNKSKGTVYDRFKRLVREGKLSPTRTLQ